MNWVIIFTRTGAEERLAASLMDRLKSNGFRPFVPTREYHFRRRGESRILRQPLFSGYLFLQTDIDADKITDKLTELLKNTNHIYSVLYYGDDKNDVAVRQHERQYWEKLFDEDFCIKRSAGFFAGDNITITSGPLKGLEANIKKISRRNREAVVEIEMMGSKRQVLLMLDMARKPDC